MISRLLHARLCIANFRSRLGGGDWFDDWVVGLQFVPDNLHHPVVGLKLPSAFSHLFAGMGAVMMCGDQIESGSSYCLHHRLRSIKVEAAAR